MKGFSQTAQTRLSLEYGICPLLPLLSSPLLCSPLLPHDKGNRELCGFAVTVNHGKMAGDVLPPPHLRPPGFRKWSFIFMFQRHEPAPLQLLHALQLCVYSHFLAKGLAVLTPKLSYFTFHDFFSLSLPGFRFMDLSSFVCYVYMYFFFFHDEPSLSLTNDS